MYSFAQREDTKVVDEPFYAYYLVKSGVDHPGREEIIQHMPSKIDEIIDQVKILEKKHKYVFLKNMAHHLIEINRDFLLHYKNIFLIRDPRELIHSFAKVIPKPNMSDIGCRQQFELFKFLNGYHDCPVIDSNSVLEDPEYGLKKLCIAINIPFDKKMVSWEKGPLSEDGVWSKYWYKNLHRSTGFTKKLKKENIELSPGNFFLYQEALPYYQSMKKNNILS